MPALSRPPLSRILLAASLLLGLGACSSATPRIVQTTASTPDIELTVGMATQIEMPDQARVQSVTVGDPSLVSAEQASDVVNLVTKGGTGETNMIVRARNEDGKVKVYQYKIIVNGR